MRSGDVASSAGKDEGTFADVITRLTASFTLSRLVELIESGTSRIADLVRAIKRYSYLDQARSRNRRS